MKGGQRVHTSVALNKSNATTDNAVVHTQRTVARDAAKTNRFELWQAEKCDVRIKSCKARESHLGSVLTPETKDSIDEESLMRLPKGVTLINMAGLEEVLEAEMLEVVSARTDFCYISDVPAENASRHGSHRGSSTHEITPQLEALPWRFRKDQP